VPLVGTSIEKVRASLGEQAADTNLTGNAITMLDLDRVSSAQPSSRAATPPTGP
jgi:hypothetical protein